MKTDYINVVAGFTKLFSTIVHSTVWREDMHVKVVWITMLAMADRNGHVFASVPGLAAAANVTLDQCLEALTRLSSPDKWSRTKTNKGRRIRAFEGGWELLNYLKYRERRDDEERRIQTRIAVAKHRKKKAKSLTVSQGKPEKAQAEAEAEAEAEAINQKQERARVISNPEAERAGDFIERYKALHVRLRKGAHYVGKPTFDFQEALQLCAVYDDSRLQKLAFVWLNTDHDFAQNGTRSVAKFRSMVSWCEERLIEWEATHGPLEISVT